MSESLVKNTNLNPKINDFRTAFIRCGCDSEILVVRYDNELDMIDLCIYETRTSLKYNTSWWQRIRYIYQMLRYGQPYTDQMILHRNQIEELKAFLNSI